MQWRLARREAARDHKEAVDSDGMFGLLVLAGVALVLGTAAFVSPALIPPAVSLAALLAAAVTALLAWRTGARRDSPTMTTWDVAGALALIGFGAGMISDATQVLQLFGLTSMLP